MTEEEEQVEGALEGLLGRLGRLLSLPVAMAMLAGALFLAGGTVAGLSYAPLAPVYLPVALHLALNAFLIWESYQQQRFPHEAGILGALGRSIFVSMGLIMLGLVNIAVAGAAVITLEVSRFWIAVLVIPGLVSLYMGGLLFDNVDEEGSENDWEEDVDEDVPEFDSTAQEAAARASHAGAGEATGLSVLGGHLFEYAIMLVAVALYIVAFLGLIFVGFTYFFLLHAVLIEDRYIPLMEFASRLPGALWGLSEPAAIMGLGLATGLGALMLFNVLDDLRKQIFPPAEEKPPNETEQRYLDKAFKALNAYFEDLTYPRHYRWIVWALWGGVAVAFFGFLFGAVEMGNAAEEALAAQRAQDIGWSLHTSSFRASFVFFIFLWIFVYWAAIQAALPAFPRFAEYLYVEQEWHMLFVGERSYYQTEKILLTYLRSGGLNPRERFEPRAFFLKIVKDHAWKVYAIAGVLTALTVGQAYLGAQSYVLFTEDKITYSRFWSLETESMTYDQVEKVDLRCFVDSEGDFDLDYNVWVTPDWREDILLTVSLDEDLDKIERIDAKLRAADVPIAPHKWTPWPLEERIGVNPQECRDELDAEYDADMAARLKRLMQVDG